MAGLYRGSRTEGRAIPWGVTLALLDVRAIAPACSAPRVAPGSEAAVEIGVVLDVNGVPPRMRLDRRMTLLDALREKFLCGLPITIDEFSRST